MNRSNKWQRGTQVVKIRRGLSRGAQSGVDIFQGPMKPWQNSRMGMRKQLPSKTKQRRNRSKAGEWGWQRRRERTSESGLTEELKPRTPDNPWLILQASGKERHVSAMPCVGGGGQQVEKETHLNLISKVNQNPWQ